MKRKIPTVLLAFIMLLGLSLLLYPTASNYWNSFRQTTAIMNYADHVDTMDPEECEKLLTEARLYNENLFKEGQSGSLTDEDAEVYNNLLNWNGNGMMGYIEIPSINCRLPIYHGTEESVLQEAVGHLNWTSLPVGGESTHSVLSGHRGLPSAKLFTDLIELEKGDIFRLVVLNEVLTYEVDQILTVEPQETDALMITEGQDYCTLVTCTPYGINTHRLLVRGHRIETSEDIESIQSTIQTEQSNHRWILLIGVLCVIIIVALIRYIGKIRKKRGVKQ